MSEEVDNELDQFDTEEFVLETDGFTGEELDEGVKTEETEEETPAVETESNEEEIVEKPSEEEEDKPGPIMIPKHRYDSASARAKAAEEKLARYEEANEKPSKKESEVVSTDEEDLDALDLKMAEALSDGNHTEVAKISKEIRAIERKAYQTDMQNNSAKVESTTRESIQFDTAVESITAQYSVFDPDAKEYNQDVVDEVLELQSAFVGKGQNPAQALYKAVGYVIKEPVVEEVKPKSPTERKTNVTKNIDTANRTPPSLSKAGVDSDKAGATALPSVSELSEEDFDALPESTKARMRGDLLQ